MGSHNGFVPTATGQVISYIRDKSEFALNRYCQYLETPEPVGLYARIDRSQVVRNPTDADWVWAPNADRPSGNFNQLRFEWVEFSTKRRNYPVALGNMTIKHNAVKIKEQSIGMVTSQAMTNRTNRVVDLLETDANWESHVDSANSLNGGRGFWNSASDQPDNPNYNAIRETLFTAARRINLDTNGQVKAKDLVLLLSPEAAQAIANSAEIHNYVKYQATVKQIENDDNPNAEWFLPPKLYGFEVVVEDAPVVTSRMTAADTASSITENRSYVKASDSAILLSRKGGINGNYGTPSFSTVQLYWLAPYEMAVFSFDDPKNDRWEYHVTDAFAEVLAAPEAGYKINAILG